jgi:hypothetical protein
MMPLAKRLQDASRVLAPEEKKPAVSSGFSRLRG